MNETTQKILAEHGETVRDALSVLVVRRYDNPARYHLFALNDEDELGFDKCVNVGAVSSTVEGELTDYLRSLNMQHFDWEQLPKDMQKFVRSHHLPIEWGGKDDSWFLGRVWAMSKRPPRAPKQRTAAEVERAVASKDDEEIVNKIMEISRQITELQQRAASRDFARMVAAPMLDRVEDEMRELRSLIEKEL